MAAVPFWPVRRWETGEPELVGVHSLQKLKE